MIRPGPCAIPSCITMEERILFSYRVRRHGLLPPVRDQCQRQGPETAHRRPLGRHRADLPAGRRASSSVPAAASVGCRAGKVMLLRSTAVTQTAATSACSLPTSSKTTPPGCCRDGRILYTRWEYVDRSREDFHQLWTMNPDGTNQMTYFGNMHPSHLADRRQTHPRHPRSWPCNHPFTADANIRDTLPRYQRRAMGRTIWIPRGS